MSRPSLTEAQKAQKALNNSFIQAKKRSYNKRPGATLESASEQAVAEPVSHSAEGGENTAAKNFRPFKGSRVARSYSTPEIDPKLLGVEIPEAPTSSASSSSASYSEPAAAQKVNTGAAAQAAAQPNHIAQELGTNKLQPLEQKESAERAVDGAFAVYGQLHTWGRMAIKVSDNKLIKMHREGRLDITRMFISPQQDPMGRGQTLQEFFADMNQQIDKEFVVSEDFKKQARGPAIRVAQKMGIGLTDEKFLAGLLLMDVTNKITMVAQMKSIMSGAIEYMESKHKEFAGEVQQKVNETLQAKAEADARVRQEAEKRHREMESKKAEVPVETAPTEITPTEEVKEENKGISLMVTPPVGPEGGDLK